MIFISIYLYYGYGMENIEENWAENNLKMIGAKVPIEFAEKFTAYCRQKKHNQRLLFYNLTKWWYEQDDINKEHICRGRIQEALLRISEEAQGRAVVSRAKAQTKRPKQKRDEKPSKSA